MPPNDPSAQILSSDSLFCLEDRLPTYTDESPRGDPNSRRLYLELIAALQTFRIVYLPFLFPSIFLIFLIIFPDYLHLHF